MLKTAQICAEAAREHRLYDIHEHSHCEVAIQAPRVVRGWTARVVCHPHAETGREADTPVQRLGFLHAAQDAGGGVRF